MWPALLGLSVLLWVLALWLAWRARRAREESGLPRGRLVYADADRWAAVARPLISTRHGLVGKPDYLVETDAGVVPVEVKRSHAPIPAEGAEGQVQAHLSHVMQLAAYCLLVEDTYGRPPPHGLIHYADATVQIPYTPALRQALLDLLAEMRQAQGEAEVRRSHQDPARCRGCGVRHACGRQALS
ncbi:MAG: CRISPR-associated protein Cas4 [Caldilineales bacterium]|nr:CRISPR-associated protein Cas4 [Caldilineales bacterium]MDW8316792.1 CRISPR-associated protein Cas4 [Anaerolineae bacterium]